MDAISNSTLQRFGLCVGLVVIWIAAVRHGLPAADLAPAMLVAGMTTSIVAVARHERFLAPSLNRWDEAMAYLGLGTLVHALG